MRAPKRSRCVNPVKPELLEAEKCINLESYHGQNQDTKRFVIKHETVHVIDDNFNPSWEHIRTQTR